MPLNDVCTSLHPTDAGLMILREQVIPERYPNKKERQMPTEKGDPRLARYRAESNCGVKNLTRMAARSEESRLAPKTHWEERWIGVINGYPKTPEAFEARRERGRAHMARLRADGHPMTRKGVPDGWRGRKAEIVQIKERAAARAAEIVAEMVADCRLSVDEQDGNAALQVAFEIMLDETVKTESRIKAAALVVQFTKAKPNQQAELTLTPAEEWLAILNKDTGLSNAG